MWLKLSLVRALSKLATAARLPLREKFWFAVLYPLSGFIRLVIILLPFRALSPFLGVPLQRRELSPLVTEPKLQMAWQVGRTCRLVGKYTPWETKCLSQAILARALLRLYGIPCVVHLGVAKKPEEAGNPLKAHAWVKVGRWVVCGGEGHRAFTILSTYISRDLLPAGPRRPEPLPHRADFVKTS